MFPLWGEVYPESKINQMIKKGNKMIKRGNTMIEEGNKEHRCGWEKCRNCVEKLS
jgi:uncharacterized protein YdaT